MANHALHPTAAQLMETVVDDPTLGIVTALPLEHAAVANAIEGLTSETRPGDGQYYDIGVVRGHDRNHGVALTCLTQYGNNAAAVAAANLLRSFPSVSHVLFVGIAAGMPRPAKPELHVRLGDVVVSDGPGVLQYDFGVQRPDGFECRAAPHRPSAWLLQGVRRIESELKRRSVLWPGHLEEFLRKASVTRPIREPPKTFRHPRDPNRVRGVPRIFKGCIGAGNMLMKSSKHRDRLVQEHGLLAIEMEGSGLADAVWQMQRGGYLVIRGVCDYGDEKKSDQWQAYAAGVAAAFLSLFLRHVPASPTASDAVSGADHSNRTGDSQSRTGLGRRFAPYRSGSAPWRDHLAAPLQRLVDKGALKEAREWIVAQWPVVKTWEHLLEFLRLAELAGGSEGDLDSYRRLARELPGRPPSELESAINYHIGRIQGQAGFVLDGLSSHERNRRLPEDDGGFWLRSRFEVGQLRFRIEHFNASRDCLTGLWSELSRVRNPPTILTVDVLKFLGTFEMLHVIFDLPHAHICLDRWSAGTSLRCEEFADQAIRLASSGEYIDGLGWAHIVRSFAKEGQAAPSEAQADLKEAESILSQGPARTSSLVHARIYRAAFLRRRGDLEAAEAALDLAEDAMPAANRRPHAIVTLQQRALVALARGERNEARQYFREALTLCVYDRALRHRHDWPVVRRLEALCQEYGWHFEDFAAGADDRR